VDPDVHHFLYDTHQSENGGRTLGFSLGLVDVCPLF
jgi:hypothetical protein